MNEMSFMSYTSYHLHTCISRFNQNFDMLSCLCVRKDFNTALLHSKEAARQLIMESVSPLPRIIAAGGGLIYGIVPFQDTFYLIGPNLFQTSIYFRHQLPSLTMDEAAYGPLCKCEFSDYLRILLLLYNLEQDTGISENDIIMENCIDDFLIENVQKIYTEMTFERHETEQPHNPYEQEFREQSSIENGDIPGLRESIAEDYVGSIGTLAKNPLRNTQNLAIVLITLASRSAIRGGLSAEIAYSFSDSYIQKTEECKDSVSVMQLAREAEFQYASMVHDIKELQNQSAAKEKNPYVRRCKDYIFSHLHDKLTVQSLAETLEISPNYLSELFKQCEGLSLSQYILHEKINRAKNLLTYSGYSYIEIASYLGFSSQSHLGLQFKKITGYTLRQYRALYGVSSR